MKRDGLSREDAGRRIASQMPQDEKKKHADFLIDTSNSFEETRLRTVDVFRQLKALTSSSN
jgi:dephospho-CoA kinase